MKPVFADTYFFLAILNPRDAAHSKALAAASSLKRPLLTTAWVLTELADALGATPDRRLFATVLADLRASPNDIVLPPDPQFFERGVQLYLSRTDKKWSLTDCLSFVAMHDHQVTEALTGDHHFEQAGYIALLK